jgi:hypothetical protein
VTLTRPVALIDFGTQWTLRARGGRTVVGLVTGPVGTGMVSGAVFGVVRGGWRRVVEVAEPDPPEEPLQAAPSARSEAATQKYLQGCGHLVD